MAHERKKRITANLSPHLATFIDDYQQLTGTSKSEIIALGLRALQEQLLAEEYAEYAHSGEFVDLETGGRAGSGRRREAVALKKSEIKTYPQAPVDKLIVFK